MPATQASHLPPTPLQTLLADIRSRSRSAAETGTAFEDLCLRYLRTEPEYQALYTRVQPYKDWAVQHGQALGLTANDKGIDLVATTHTGDHHAVQCKCYAPDHSVAKPDIDSFLSASGHKAFAARILIDTTLKPWGANAEEMLQHQRIPVLRIDLHKLEDSAIDWARYKISQPDAWDGAAGANAAIPLKPKHAPRPYQQKAMDDVLHGLHAADRGKLIMACGTGKTFTALKIAESQAGKGKTVLFLVPSLALLSQTLTEWSQQSQTPMTAFAVCSDSEVGKQRSRAKDDDSIHMALHELAYPATTDAAKLAKEYTARHAPDAMTVVFSTYHSIDVLHQAQQQGLPAFDLVICDEAHRSTGQTWEGDDESAFVRIHDNAFVRAHKRLYMTATPRIYAVKAQEKAKEDHLALYSMDDATIFGATLHTLSFSQAVEQNLLVPYKVVVLTIAEQDVDDILRDYLTQHAPQAESIPVNDAAKIVGCFKALAKVGLSDLADDPAPMQRAVAFCQVIGENAKGEAIRTGKTAARHVAKTFADVVDEYQQNADDEERIALNCAVDYVHGGMGAAQKSEKLAWLKAPLDQDACRILTNVRCLAEGVDVPALDAVLFLAPRNAQIEVVQSVGRVMRKSPGKKRGYIILPVVIPYGVEPHKALNDNKTYKVVWQVLQALRAHDDEFERMINRIELLGSDPAKIQVIDPIGLAARRRRQSAADQARARSVKAAQYQYTIGTAAAPQPTQGELDISTGEIERAILAKVVEKVGARDYWDQWAADIARIAQLQIARIRAIVQSPDKPQARAAFDAFAAQLHQHINTRIGEDDIIEMLAQHLITKPVFDALFGSSDFTRANPVSAALQAMTDALLGFHLDAEQQTLDSFYAHIRKKTEGISDPAARQTLIVTLYDQFFAQAFPRVVQKHGIVYTPVEIVDFILQSVAHVLRVHFGKTVSDPAVHVLDPFTGTGTFIARLIASGLIPAEHLPQVYAQQLHATEILLLPYYIAAVNIESTYAQAQPHAAYTPFPGILLADTFNIPTEKTETLLENKNDALAANNARRRRQMDSKITVIVGNPPYSIGAKSEMGADKNIRYPELDSRIEHTYAAQSTAVLKKGLYDSYIRAIRWASDRIDPQAGGVIGFVTNAGWIDTAAMAGLRKCLMEEFSSLYVFHLRGNQRTIGEESRREGGKVFGSGSRAPIAISILVKAPAATLSPDPSPTQGGGERLAPRPLAGEGLGRGCDQIHFCDIGDYLSTEQKLQKIAALQSIAGIAEQGLWQHIEPDAHGDWLRQRQGGFADLLPMGDKENKNKPDNTGMFENFSLGVVTNRDPWCNNPARQILLANVARLVQFYETQRTAFNTQYAEVPRAVRGEYVEGFISSDKTQISWTRALKKDMALDKPLVFHPHAAVPTLYRPFSKAWLYYDRRLNEMVYQMPQIFPLPAAEDTPEIESAEAQGTLFDAPQATLFSEQPHVARQPVKNRVIAVSTVGAKTFSVLMSDCIIDLHVLESGTQCFPRHLYDKTTGQQQDAITDATLAAFHSHYPKHAQDIDKDQIFDYLYGILHSPDYRRTYAHNLTKELPRIPLVERYADFCAFAAAGKQLGELHVNFDSAPVYAGVDIVIHKTGCATLDALAPQDFYVQKMTFGKTGKDKDRSTIVYNPHISVRGIPPKAHDYIVNGRSAIEWVMERQCVKTDKESGIVSDANRYALETVGRPRYPLELLLRVITVSLQTLDIVRHLPALDDGSQT